MFKAKTSLKPDLDVFHQSLVQSVDAEKYDSIQVARDFRELFLKDEKVGKRVLFMLLSWCGEYDFEDDGEPVPPLDPSKLQRWAGKREIAALIKAAMHGTLEK